MFDVEGHEDSLVVWGKSFYVRWELDCMFMGSRGVPLSFGVLWSSVTVFLNFT